MRGHVVLVGAIARLVGCVVDGLLGHRPRHERAARGGGGKHHGHERQD
jgi:hypothetical protein